MTRNSDPQAEPAAAERSVREPTEEEAERAAAQFRAAWQTPAPEPDSGGATAVPQAHGASNDAAAGVAAHPILAVASQAAEAQAAASASSPLGRTMVGVPPPPSEARAATGGSTVSRPPPTGFNRTMVGIPVPAPGAGLAVDAQPPAARQSGTPAAAPAPAAPAGTATIHGTAWRADAVPYAAAPLGSPPPRPASFPPPAAEAHHVPEPRAERISVRPNVISAWNLPPPNESRRRKPSPALIVLVVASVTLLILVVSRFLGSDAESTTEGQPSRTEAVLAEDEARDEARTPNTRVQAAKPGSSGE